MRLIGWIIVLTAALALVPAARAEVRFPARPTDGTVLDGASMLDGGDLDTVRALGAALVRDKGFPLVVVTIDSLADYDASSMSIESYARRLFDTWGAGRPDQNYGILLLVSRGDRKARIELGAAWSHGHDQICQSIMDDLILPNFRAGRFSEGIRVGAQALDKMGRGEEIPSRPIAQRAGDTARSFWTKVRHNLTLLLLLPVLVISSIYNRIVYGTWSNPNSSGSGGSGGGGFGGGFSGGGGASGSW
ncbi:MAG TPA: TPM domain-containing protein [Phycisphaerales bacterium]|nr:TPM domain-containing protein [Phycisphaerales bacterium]